MSQFALAAGRARVEIGPNGWGGLAGARRSTFLRSLTKSKRQ